MKNTTMDILLIEGNIQEANLIKEMLSEVRGQQFSVQHVQCLAAALELLQGRSFDVLILDLGLPDSQGLDTIVALRNREKSAPVIALTVLDDEEMEIKSLEMDIQDYLVKGELNPGMLKRSIRYAIQRKRAVEELRRSEAKFATVFQAAPVLLAISRPIGGEIIDVNDKVLRTCGYQREEVIGRSSRELCIWENPEDRDEVVRALLETGPVRNREINFRDKAGQRVIGLMSAELVEIESERYMLTLVKDITEQKRAESEIKLLNDALTGRASELENYNEELVAFNYMVSHDLRQPLTNISIACQAIEILKGSKLDEETKELLQMAKDGVEQMDALIGTLLRFSSSAHRELHLKTVELSEIAKLIAATMRLSDPGRQVTFKIAEGMTANGDAELLKVALENLLGNAWKYTGKKEQALIEFGSAEIEGGRAYFVRDNGPGFGAADAEKLFIPFNRLARTAEFAGHGIGLATVARIIRRHEGAVWAAGEPGKGATFYFTLGLQPEIGFSRDLPQEHKFI